jgi:hypothetical protein
MFWTGGNEAELAHVHLFYLRKILMTDRTECQDLNGIGTHGFLKIPS